MRYGVTKTVLVASALIGMLALAACEARPANAGNTITMNADRFINTSLTVKVGTTVTFADQSGGATHFLAIGTDGEHASETGAPEKLEAANGIEIDAGQMVPIVFATPGTYHITCIIHPTMNAIIIVHS